MSVRFHRQRTSEEGKRGRYFAVVVVPDAAAEQAADEAWHAAISAEKKLWAAGDMKVSFDQHWAAVADERVPDESDVSTAAFLLMYPADFIGSLLKFLAGGNDAKFSYCCGAGSRIEMWKEPQSKDGPSEGAPAEGPAKTPKTRISVSILRTEGPPMTCSVSTSEFIDSLAHVVEEYPEAAIRAFLKSI